MKSLFILGAALLGLPNSFADAAAIAKRVELAPFTEKRADLGSRELDTRQTSCNGVANGPTTRQCWTNGFTASTDTTTSWPNTGRIVSYDLSITNTTCNPDGHGPRICMLINGQYPGPVLTANWGDTFQITVRNKLQNNGTSIHWHGFRQLNTNYQDGTNGITECALAPGDFKTYQFQATEYGTTWYHSHFSNQYGEGVVGTIVVNGPATANYDVDLGTYPLSDWYYLTSFQAAALAFQNGQAGQGPPQGDNILINGTNKNAAGGGAYSKVSITAGKKYRLRLINTSLDAQLLVDLDGHPFQVIATDFVPVVPYTTNYVQIGIGQRYDVIFTANQTPGNYWFRASADGVCQSRNAGTGLAIFTYTGQTVANPTTTAPASPPTTCINPAAPPFVSKSVDSTTFQAQSKTLPVAFGPVAARGNTVLWTVNGTSLLIDPGYPTLKYIAQGITPPAGYNAIDLGTTTATTWIYWVIQQAAGAPPIAHPIHLHGHDFSVLGTGTGTFSYANNFAQLNFSNPNRRDVAQLPGGGWLVIAYQTDNPGAWLMHCHIAFHVGNGLGVQFLERKSQITLPAQNSAYYTTCQKWNTYVASHPVYPQNDSGLKKRWPPLLSDSQSPA